MVSVLNNEETRLIGMKPVDAIKETLVEQGFSKPTQGMKKNYLTLVPRLDIFMSRVN